MLVEVRFWAEAELAYLSERTRRQIYRLKMLPFIFGHAGILKPTDFWVIAQATVYQGRAAPMQPPDECKAGPVQQWRCVELRGHAGLVAGGST